tara:strand:- start:53 stop:268 length:216 start_codon:yes stop_codon:yes gene_type:complete
MEIERTKSFSNAEFNALSRNDVGEIINLSDHFVWLTDKQIDRLHDDDWSRVIELQEEIEIMKADFLDYEMT